ncbi:MAG: Coat domain protein [Firmicutes bacterium]|nr:Coat domain protein [Bacillota bacterium]
MVQQNNSSQQQSNAQMQNSGQMNGQASQFSEQNVLQMALNDSKLMAGSLNNYILEASDEQLRRDYMTVLGDVYGQQKQIFDIMEQKGYYQTQAATPQAINQAKQKFMSINK